MVIGHVVEMLGREVRLLFGEVPGNGRTARKRFGDGDAVVKAPEKIGRDDPIERVQIPLEQGAREALEEFVSFGR